MPRTPDFISPSVEQAEAWQNVNDALGQLAVAYGVAADDVVEIVGHCTETIIGALVAEPAA